MFNVFNQCCYRPHDSPSPPLGLCFNFLRRRTHYLLCMPWMKWEKSLQQHEIQRGVGFSLPCSQFRQMLQGRVVPGTHSDGMTRSLDSSRSANSPPSIFNLLETYSLLLSSVTFSPSQAKIDVAVLSLKSSGKHTRNSDKLSILWFGGRILSRNVSLYS